MVRSFPRTTPRASRLHVFAVCAALLLTSIPALAPFAAADKLRDRQHKVRGQISHAQGDLEDSSKALGAATRRVERARAALAAAQKRLSVAEGNANAAALVDAQMQARLQQAEHDLVVARKELVVARANVVEQRRQIGELAASNYSFGDPALMGLAVILNSQNPAELTSQMNTVDSLMNRQDQQLDQLREARAKLVEQEKKVEAAAKAVGVQRKAAAANLVRMRGLQQAAAKVRTEVAGLVVRSRAAEAAALRARRADLAQLRALKKQENRIKRMIIKRARAQKHAGGYKGASGGFLYRPVPGEVTSPYGWRRHPIYGYWGLHDGTDFRAPCGTPMRAAGTGTVISRYFSSVYGNRLYLDLGQVNGKNMTVVYNHASSYRAGVGSRVARGEVVGWSGDTGWSTACHLHFTVLLNGNPTNPMNYM